jgi:hypothetical protein
MLSLRNLSSVIINLSLKLTLSGRVGYLLLIALAEEDKNQFYGWSLGYLPGLELRKGCC